MNDREKKNCCIISFHLDWPWVSYSYNGRAFMSVEIDSKINDKILKTI